MYAWVGGYLQITRALFGVFGMQICPLKKLSYYTCFYGIVDEHRRIIWPCFICVFRQQRIGNNGLSRMQICLHIHYSNGRTRATAAAAAKKKLFPSIRNAMRKYHFIVHCSCNLELESLPINKSFSQ